MPDIFLLIANWWKQMLLFVLLAVLIAGTIVMLKGRLYLSVATALPSSSFNADKSRIFNENIQALYSDFGVPDDLDKIIGTAQLDTIYSPVVDQFNLTTHYKLPTTDINAKQKAIRELKERSKVMKSDYGELQVKVWDRDKEMAASLANAIMENLRQFHGVLQSENNNNVLKGLKISAERVKLAIDSINLFLSSSNRVAGSADVYSARQKVLLNQYEQYEKLITQYDMMVTANPEVLLWVEKAKPAVRADKPKRVVTVVVTAFISFLFALLLALVLEKRNSIK
jgi:uncharacterized protein involved in exopolysaccharide biosynthesis